MDSRETLEKYLMFDFGDRQHKKKSLIEIYVSDREFYKLLVENNRISTDVEMFFKLRGGDLVKAYKSTPVEAFQIVKYGEIVDRYLNSYNPNNSDILKNNDITLPSSKNKEKVDDKFVYGDFRFHCVDDMSLLIKIDERKVKSKKTNNIITFPMFACPECDKMYTNASGYKDLIKIYFAGKNYTNIDRKRDKRRYEKYLSSYLNTETKSSCYVYGVDKDVICRDCGLELYKISIKMNVNKKHRLYNVRYCDNCDLLYISTDIYMEEDFGCEVLNESEILDLVREVDIKREKKAKKREKIKAKQARKEKKAEEQRKQQENSRKRNNQIEVRDFVVRRTAFKCRHNDHNLQNIDAIINILDKNGNIKQEDVAAGYCSECDVFFIMESTYQQLRMKGIPLCRISDEKTYNSNNMVINGMHLAQESLLKQYGYTVSEAEGLSQFVRRNILGFLIDSKVLTKNEVISYLDFFINQRKFQYKFERAISKWKSDRDYIAEYRIGDFREYCVGEIYRKH